MQVGKRGERRRGEEEERGRGGEERERRREVNFYCRGELAGVQGKIQREGGGLESDEDEYRGGPFRDLHEGALDIHPGL